MAKDNENLVSKIDDLILDITESNEFKKIQYLIATIRTPYLMFLSSYRLDKFVAPSFIKPLINYIDIALEKQDISLEEVYRYMFKDGIKGINGNMMYCYFIINPKLDASKTIDCSKEVFIHVFAGFILDFYNYPKKLDINEIISKEEFQYSTNSYKLTTVNDVEFKSDYFIYDGKAYLYNLFTRTAQIQAVDEMPGFARIITDYVKNGDILLRLDERLALPKEQAITYSSINFERFRGPQLDFNNIDFADIKTITVHYTPAFDKLLMVIKKDYDQKNNKEFLHIELETLPHIDEKCSVTNIITTFLHGMYYIEDDYFTHIDYANNQYSLDVYRKKYSDCNSQIPIDQYTETKQLHYKSWCIEGGTYSKEIWYKLMLASLNKKYQTLLAEMLKSPISSE